MSVSTRVLRKFQGDRDIVSSKPEEEGSDVDETPFSGGVRKKQLNVNRYDLLNQHSQSESEVKEDDDDNDNDEEMKKTNTGHCDTRESTRRKKKKKRKKQSQSNQRQSSDDVDEVERSVREVNAILGDSGIHPAKTKVENDSNSRKGIFSVEHKHLNPKNELRRIFGSKIIQTEHNKRRGRGRGHVKSTWLVTPKEHWPLIDKLGLSMKLLETKDDCLYFAYEHSISYQNVEKKFLDAVESLDPDNIVAIANSHPYHVDTMIQLSNICKLSEDLAMAAELIERALYSLESAFHPLFNIAKGNCRLDYKRQENRALYITVFKHLVFVGQRACYRTALEFCKLLLSLDPEGDPLAIILMIDFYAIRSREFTWLLQLVQEQELQRNLSQLPNMAFSKAVAQYHLCDPEADSSLQEALLMFPGLLIPLLDKCGVQPDPKTQSHSYFTSGVSSQSPALNRLVQLYVHRSYHIWKESEMLAWLEKNTLEVLRRVDQNDPVVTDFANKRIRRYEAKSPIQIDRHIFLSDIKEVTAFLAENSTASTTFSFDPLPPTDSINIYTRRERPAHFYEHSNIVSLFFRSIMPNFDDAPLPLPEGEEREQEQHAPEEEGAAGRLYLHRSVNNLFDAMRNLLINYQHDQQDLYELSETPLESDNDDEDGDDDDDDEGYGHAERQI